MEKQADEESGKGRGDRAVGIGGGDGGRERGGNEGGNGERKKIGDEERCEGRSGVEDILNDNAENKKKKEDEEEQQQR